MAKDVASDALRPSELHSERIGFIVGSRSHRQANHNSCSYIEFSRRQYDERMNILHFAAGLRIAINPNHVAPVRAP